MSHYLSLGLQFLFSLKREAAKPDFFIFNQKICIIFLCCCKENILLFSGSSYRSYNWLLYLQVGHKPLIDCISQREDIQRLVLLVCNQDQSPFLQLLLFSPSRGRAIRLLQLLVEYLVLFILKKNRKLRIYINYRQLNSIIRIDILYP